MPVGYVYDDFMTKHENELDPFHPENPQRIKVIYEELKKCGLLDQMQCIKSRSATKEELLVAHTNEYIDSIYKIFEENPEDPMPALSDHGWYDSLYANQYTLQCAEIAAGSTIELITSILNDDIDSGFAIVRPPGHHATESEPSGFCFFNNVALAALVAKQNNKKVAVVDWDVHYGNGTASILSNINDVEFFSIHRHDNGGFYPYNGDCSEVQNIYNYPMNKQCGDEEFIHVFIENIIPQLRIFGPDIIIVSSGFDAVAGDTIGGFSVTPAGFAIMLKLMMNVQSKIACVLEGGYNLKIIPQCAKACVEALLEES